ncbi:hypothetical protein TWF481_003711 [Arthrobotrys musiformis]|uniref:Uncharacterized protein n=1 Tax=Arthrobotrys musiformis TaxID=47236 RepID=A0AAV9WHI2_9PEZI
MPEGLSELYSLMLQQIKDLPDEDAGLCYIMLSTMALAYQPLRLVELTTLTDLENDEAESDMINSLVSACGSFLTVREDTIYFVHHSAKDFLTKTASSIIFPGGGPQDIHRSIFSHSLQAMSETLRRNIYNLSGPEAQINSAEIPNPDPLAATGYSCKYWAEHLREAIVCTDEGFIQAGEDYDRVLDFIQNNFLYWIEALSLMGLLSDGARMIVSLLGICRASTRSLYSLAKDAKRFILKHRSTIEERPLQLYSSCLLFSPRQSLIRSQYWHEVSSLVQNTPTISIQEDWDSCLQTIAPRSTQLAYSYRGISEPKISFSPDGSILASFLNLGFGNAIYNVIELRSVATGGLYAKLEHKTDCTGCFFFTSDGKFLASLSSSDGTHFTILVWNTATGIIHAEFDTTLYDCIFFSSDSKLLALFSGLDNTIRLWNITSRTLVAKFDTGEIHSFLLSSDDKFLAYYSEENETIQIWKTAAKAPCAKFAVGSIKSFELSPDSKLLVYLSGADKIKIWDIDQREFKAELDGVSSFSISASSEFLVLQSGGMLQIYDIGSNIRFHVSPHGNGLEWLRRIFSIPSQLLGGPGYEVAVLSPNSKFLAFVLTTLGNRSDPPMIQIWNTTTRALHAEVRAEHGVIAVDFSTNSEFLVSCGSQGMKIWDIATGALQFTTDISYPRISDMSFSFSPDSTLLACYSSSDTIKIWDISSFAHSKAISDLGHGSGCALATNHGDANESTSALFNTLGGSCYMRHQIHTKISPDGTLLASYSNESTTIKVWGTESPAPASGLAVARLWQCEMPSKLSSDSCVGFSPDSKFLSVIRCWGTVARVDMYHASTGVLHTSFKDIPCIGKEFEYNFSSDSSLLAVYCPDVISDHQGIISRPTYQRVYATVYIWDTSGSLRFCVRKVGVRRRGPRFLHRRSGIKEIESQPKTIAFSPNNKLLAFSSYPTRMEGIKVFNLGTGDVQVVLGGFCASSRVSFSSDSRFLAVLSRNPDLSSGHPKPEKTEVRDTFIFVWNVQTGTLDIKLKCDIGYASVSTTGVFRAKFEGHTSQETSVFFSPDGTLLASWSRDDGTIRFWDLPTESQSPLDLQSWRALRLLTLPPEFKLSDVRIDFERKVIIVLLESYHVFVLQL